MDNGVPAALPDIPLLVEKSLFLPAPQPLPPPWFSSSGSALHGVLSLNFPLFSLPFYSTPASSTSVRGPLYTSLLLLGPTAVLSHLPPTCPTASLCLLEGGIGWGEHRQVACFHVCPQAQMVLLPSTQHTSYQHWHRDLGGTIPKVPWLGHSLGKEEMMHLWNAANNYLLLLRKQWFSMIHAWQKKNTLKEFALMQKWTFLSNCFGYFFVPWMFSKPRVCNEILTWPTVNCSTLSVPGNIM